MFEPIQFDDLDLQTNSNQNTNINQPKLPKRSSMKVNRIRNSERKPKVNKMLSAPTENGWISDSNNNSFQLSQTQSARNSIHDLQPIFQRSSTVDSPYQIPQLLDGRDSVNSIVTGALFDPQMWGTRDDKTSNLVQTNRSSIGHAETRGHSFSNSKLQEAPSNMPQLPPLQESLSKSDKFHEGGSNELQNSQLKELPDYELQKSKNDYLPNSNDKSGYNVLPELHRGTALLKYPRHHGFPHFKHVQLSNDNTRLQWFSKRKHLNETCIHISDVREIVEGQKTEVFKRYQQPILNRASFSIVWSHNYKTFDVVAKSADECQMWVLTLRKLVEMQRAGTEVIELTTLDVGVRFCDRNRPQSRRGSGNFIRANNSKVLNVDYSILKEVKKDLKQLNKSYSRVVQLVQKDNISRSDEFDNIQQVLSELEERLDELRHEVNTTRNTDMSQRDVWRANVDLAAIQEKVEVLSKYYDSNGQLKS